MKSQTRRLTYVWYLSSAFLLLAAAATVRADVTPETRISITSQGQLRDRGTIKDSVVSHDELAALVTSGSRNKSTRASGQQKVSGAVSLSGTQSPNVDFWIYDASVELYSDLDRDGYYAGIDLTFDADTVYSVADVYAVLYLSYDFGPWNEYAYTEDFTIFGASGDDEYFVETELVSGYPTGDYDILIELFDVYDGSYVASFGPEDSSQLSYLPLEDTSRDTPQTTVVVIDNGGGGSLSLLGLFALLGVAGLSRKGATDR
ncbi:MAG: GlyGly-CTERM sorting domain-containing protein [Chromatiales bacterium]|nr:MAG: GlyGly-CTERM sorting domain-containing protein [Chromatiales bacterium]